jgi:uncharacterized protein
MEIGKYAVMEVKRFVDFGLYLETEDGQTEVLLPRKYVPDGTKAGDFLDVFIYKDSEDRPVATTLKPYATVGEVAWLKATSVDNIGAFLDWGLAKDILVPFREQKMKMEEGRYYLVYIYVDEVSGRVAASAKLEKFIKNDELDVQPGEEVNLIVGDESPVGIEVIINNKHWGMLYKNEVFRQLHKGHKLNGFIKKIREDNKIDVSLQKQGYDEVEDASEKIKNALSANDGFLPLTDKSNPEEIAAKLQMSKKVFKKAIGALYKQREIALEENGIRLAGSKNLSEEE